METTLHGLSSSDALARLNADGPNALSKSTTRGPLALALSVAREPMFLLLLGASGLSLFLGELHESLTLLFFVLVVMAITVIQEGRTERTLEALRNLSSPRANVIRDGTLTTIAGVEVVRDDLLRVVEGDRVAADATLLEAHAVSVDESLLTGESVPVFKKSQDRLFAGTLVVAGRGLARVTATGARTEFGRLGASLAQVNRGRSVLQHEIDTVVRRVSIGALALAVSLVVIRLVQGSRWPEAALSGIALAMALLPEEFPVVLTVFLAIGAWRLSKQRVLTRTSAAVEALGAIDVLCTDKTGTLTQNTMAVRRLVPIRSTANELVTEPGVELANPGSELPEAVHALVEFAVLASPQDPFDPMERAFHALAHQSPGLKEHLHPAWAEARVFPLSSELLAVTHLWRGDDAGPFVVATKGAPEAIFDLCHLSADALARCRDAVRTLAQDGLRVLAVAKNTEPVDALPVKAHDVDFTLLGLVGLEDPLRDGVRESIASAQAAKIQVMMITGDHRETALAIATKAGLHLDEVMTGDDIDSLDDERLSKKLRRTSVVARAAPRHKLRIVQCLKAHRVVVAMTGDGVNDAPALKSADVGIAMGGRGTDVAREAAALVLVDDSFTSIVKAIELGRRVFGNLRKSVSYVLAVHVPLAGLSLIPPFLGWGPLLGPLHVVFVELLIDPACSIVFEGEPAEPDVMHRPPRGVAATLFTTPTLFLSLFRGTAALGGTLGASAWAIAANSDGRTAGFVALIVSNLMVLLTSRTETRAWWRGGVTTNRSVWVLFSATLAALSVTLFVPSVRQLFGFQALKTLELLGATAMGALPVIVGDLLVRAFRAARRRVAPTRMRVGQT